MRVPRARSHHGIAVLRVEIIDHPERAVDVAAGRIVLGEHHHRALLELEGLRRQAAALQRRTKGSGPLVVMAKTCVLPPSLASCALVDLVNGGVVGEEKRATRRKADPCRSAARRDARDALPLQALERMAASTSRNGCVALPVLLGQIADGRREIAPGGRGMGELRTEGSAPSPSGSMASSGSGAPPAEAGRSRRPGPPAGRRTGRAIP